MLTQIQKSISYMLHHYEGVALHGEVYQTSLVNTYIFSYIQTLPVALQVIKDYIERYGEDSFPSLHNEWVAGTKEMGRALLAREVQREFWQAPYTYEEELVYPQDTHGHLWVGIDAGLELTLPAGINESVLLYRVSTDGAHSMRIDTPTKAYWINGIVSTRDPDELGDLVHGNPRKIRVRRIMSSDYANGPTTDNSLADTIVGLLKDVGVRMLTNEQPTRRFADVLAAYPSFQALQTG